MEMLIGDKKELLAQLKTKDNAVHVGHSLLQETQKVSQPYSVVDYKLSLNNNQLIVQVLMETKDATEDGWIMPSNTLLIKVSNQKLHTHTLEFKVHANLIQDHSKLNHSLMSLPETVLH